MAWRKRERKIMTATVLPMMVDCSGSTIRNDALQPLTDPILTVRLAPQDGTNYLLPLSELGTSRLFQLISDWRRARDFLSELQPPEPTKRQ